MLAIQLSINVLWLPLLVILSAICGFAYRSSQITKFKKQISSLEKEMLNSHAEILKLQEEMVRLQKNNSNSKSLVVAMKDMPAEDSNELRKDKSTRTKVN